MNRRQFLGAAGLGGLTASAGCLDGLRGWGRPPEPRPVDEGDAGGPSVVSRAELRRGAAKDAIPAITAPAFAGDWVSADAALLPDEPVVGVEVGSETRAYPISVLAWHGVVNDVFDLPSRGSPTYAPLDEAFSGSLLVSYCPLTGSSAAADRHVAGEVRTFGVSGLLWRSSLVLYDRESVSLWSHLLGTAIDGPLAGVRLTRYPTTTTTWGEWRGVHPETTVLLPPPASDTVKGWQTRDYDIDPYAGYELSTRLGVGDHPAVDVRLHPKTVVVGVTAAGRSRAYPLDAVEAAGVVNDTVGDRPVVVAATRSGSLVAYDRRVGDAVFEFDRVGDVLLGGGSRWQLLTGRAVDGPHVGRRLVRADGGSPMYWFAWARVDPTTELFG